MKKTGTITGWNDDRGFGFIEADNSRVFLHIKALREPARRPEDGDVVTFATTEDPQGRLRAVDAALVEKRASRKERARGRGPNHSIVVAVCFVLWLGASVVFSSFPWQVLATCLAISVVTFVAYARDKWAAKSGRWRTSENTLLGLGLIGGWPGAFVAQQTLRHKSKKRSFRLALWATAIVNACAIAWLHTAQGRAELDKVLGELARLVQ